MIWVTLCKRTNDPKLAWIEYHLDRAGIPNRRRGVSFHAPILEVDIRREDEAWEILKPVDDIADDAYRFQGFKLERDFQRERYDECASIRASTIMSAK